MRHLSEIAPLVRVLGCYERDNFFSFSAQVAKTNGARKVVVKQSTPAVSLNILIVGFGNFGQFLSKELVRQGHNVSAWNVTDESLNAQKLSVVFESDLNNFAKFERRFDVVIFSVSIMAFANVVASFPFHFECFASSLIVDVLSVKMYAKQILSLHVPKSADILLTHPMFGRESGKRSWINLPMVFEKLRITDIHRCSCFLSIFSSKGCEMLEMQSETHDAYSAGSQFITHLTGRILSRLGPSSTPINTKGFEVLLQLVENTCKDSWELFYGIFKHNPRSLEQLGAFEEAFLDVKQILLSDLQSNSSDTSEIEFSPRITAIQQSGTAAIFDLAESLRRQGKPIISLSVGEPDFPVPKPIKEAIVDALMKDQTKYTPIAGVFELRKSIAEKLKKENGLDYAPEQIVVSNGAKQSIVQAAMALVRPGDQVLIPTPYWTSYRDMVTLSGGKTIEIPCSYEAGYKLSAENLRKNLMNAKRARLLMLNYPSNPTGVIYSKEELFALARVLEEFPDVFIISDEIYEHIMYEGEHVSFASLPRMHERTITVNGFSKAFCMTGLRIGYAAASKQIVSQLVKIQSHLTSSACSISQYGAIAALKLEKSVISGMVEKFKQRRDVIVSRFQKIKGMRILVPHGAFYIYADISVLLNENTKGLKSDSEFCMELLEKYNIAAVPGAAFGLSGCFRISYATSDENISKALDGIEKFVQDLYS
jgi:aspartate/methionine/tyrosine aminotransferase/prephenate dehydrogenase